MPTASTPPTTPSSRSAPTEIILRVDTRWLRFTPTSMTHSNNNTSNFSLQENGTVTLGESNEEMDLAAERLAREMMS